MPMYETMLVTSAKLDEEATTALVAKFTGLIEANGTIDAVDAWGKRRLAYPINKEEDGIYTLIHFTSPAGFPAELDRVYKITDGVLRTLIIVKDEVMEAARVEAAGKAAAAREAAEKARAERAAAEKARAEAEAKAAAEKQKEQKQTAEPAAEPQEDEEAGKAAQAPVPEDSAKEKEEPAQEEAAQEAE